MGGGQSAEPDPLVDHAGFSDQDFAELGKRLGVTEDDPEARVEMAVFLEKFNPHLRPLVQPIFFRLGREAIGEPSASWPVLVASISRLVTRGISWETLLKVWNPDAAAGEPGTTLIEPGSPIEEGGAAAQKDALLPIELAASLCFWCAYPDLKPTAGDGTDSSANLEVFVEALQAAAAGGAGIEEAAKRLTEWAPRLPQAVGAQFARALFGAALPPLSETTLPPSVKSQILNQTTLLLLRSVEAYLWDSEPWMPLYRNWKDGESFPKLIQGIKHYEGPALVLIRTEEGHIMGALSKHWQEGNGKFTGGSECFLFSLLPRFGVFRSESRDGNWVYLNSRNKHHPIGLGFGGQMNFWRLWLDADHKECSVMESCATYGKGLLLPSEKFQTRFKPQVIEIWGIGGEEAKEAQAKAHQRDAGDRDQLRKVDKARFLDSDFDKEMFLGNTFAGSRDARERAGPDGMPSCDTGADEDK